MFAISFVLWGRGTVLFFTYFFTFTVTRGGANQLYLVKTEDSCFQALLVELVILATSFENRI